VGLVTVETLVDGVSTRYDHFADREAALRYVQGLPSEVKTVIRDSSLEDVFVKLTGKKVGENEIE
jgi:ABC-2 type transport system ATP-binding protein